MKKRPLRLTLRQLSVFVAVAQQSTTVGAADELAPSQSAVSGALADLDQAHELEDLTLPSGVQLRVAASNTIGSYILPALLAGFRHAQSGPCALDMRIGNTRETLQTLLKFEADIGLVEGHCQGHELVCTHWGDDEMVVVVSPSHALARHPPSAAALREADWVVREPGSGTREIIEKRLAPHLGPLRFALELGNAEAIKRAVMMSGFGVSCPSPRPLG